LEGRCLPKFCSLPLNENIKYFIYLNYFTVSLNLTGHIMLTFYFAKTFFTKELKLGVDPPSLEPQRHDFNAN
jgi:hypothetical protein